VTQRGVVDFVRERGIALLLVVGVMLLITLVQGGISYSIADGPLHRLLPRAAPAVATGLYALRLVLLLLLFVLWVAGHRRALFGAIVVANALFTVALLLDTFSLLSVLAGITPRSVRTLMADVALMAVSNVLVFSIWYWIVDPPGVDDRPHEEEPWAFLFPQRANAIPHYGQWMPRYVDYLFVAFTTSLAFSPTDTLPLTRSAKLLTMLQASISVVTLTGIAGSAINVLANG